MERKPLPIGVEDFADVKRNSVYVDKTFLIREIVKNVPSSAFLYTRPRRFGKSLALSMLRYFFEISGEDKTDLFKDTEIFSDKDIWDKHFSSYPVIYLNFKDVNDDDGQSLLKITKTRLAREYERHSYLLESDSLSEGDKSYFRDVISFSLDDSDFPSALERLTYFLFLHHKKRVIVLIDEYDTPIRVAHEIGAYDEVIRFFRRLFGEALKGNPFLHYAVMTGILQVSKESLFSGLNNLRVDNVLETPLKKEPFGFSQEEVDMLLREFGLSEMREEFREWYDGYLFGENKAYNPWSVLNAIQNGKLEAYWSNTSEKNALYAIFARSASLTNGLFALLSNKEKTEKVDLAISYKDLEAFPSYLWSYLLATGYLTIKGKVGSSYSLRMPNKEIESVFEKEIVDRYIPSERSELPDELKSAFLGGDKERIKFLFENWVLNSFSYYDLNKEKEYQIMLISLLVASLKGFKIRSEVNSREGRSDILAYSGNPSSPSLIIEVKSFKSKTSSKRLKDAASKAVVQIKEKNYISELRGTEAKKVLYYGLAFAERSLEVACEEAFIA